MSKDRLLSDDGLRAEIANVLLLDRQTMEPYVSVVDDLINLVNTQRRLYAESVLDEVLVAIDKNIEASKGNLKYARDHNNSDRTIANWKGCIEGEKFIKDDVMRLRAEQRVRIN